MTDRHRAPLDLPDPAPFRVEVDTTRAAADGVIVCRHLDDDRRLWSFPDGSQCRETLRVVDGQLDHAIVWGPSDRESQASEYARAQAEYVRAVGDACAKRVRARA